jgi:hypothetical protein
MDASTRLLESFYSCIAGRSSPLPPLKKVIGLWVRRIRPVLREFTHSLQRASSIASRLPGSHNGEGTTIACVTGGRLKWPDKGERKAVDAATVRFVCAVLAVLFLGMIAMRRKKSTAK